MSGKSYWQKGEPLCAEDMRLLRLIKKRASELGYTPSEAEVRGSGMIKRRFRLWSTAVYAAGLPQRREQTAQRRLELRKRADASSTDNL